MLGHDVVREPLAVRRRIGLAGQFAAVDEELTGRENVEMIAPPVPTVRRRVAPPGDRGARAVRAREAADRRVATYSGGMRRRLDLAAGLIGRPPVVLLDEPTTGLDPRSRQELWRVVDELRRDGTTVLLTTQYLEEADRLAQQIAVVDQGRIAARGHRGRAEGDGRRDDPERPPRRPPADAGDASTVLAEPWRRASSRVSTPPTARFAWPSRIRPPQQRRSAGWTPAGSGSRRSSFTSRRSTTCS